MTDTTKDGFLDMMVDRISGVGIVVGGFAFAVSLTPSLIPRSDLVQGILAGASFSAGYAVGLFGWWIWQYLQLPVLPRPVFRRLLVVSGCVSALTMLVFLAQATGWQNSIRQVMDMPPVEGTRPMVIAGLAACVALMLVGMGKVISILCSLAVRRIERVVRPRLARLLGIAVVLLLVVFIGNGVLLRGVLAVVDSSARGADALIQPEVVPPADAGKVGSPQSLLDWADLGREGRNFVGGGPSADEIAHVTLQPARDPVRVYAGLNTAQDAQARAMLAVQELERVGGFEREILIVAMPTGTGWMDPAAFEPLEYLHHGDVATVAIQYSYLKSWLSLLVEPELSVEAGRALFTTVYARWKELPPDARPRLYLYGLSLGAYSSQQSIRLHEIIDQSLSGALWVGPPFVSPLWQDLTAERNEGSPPWRPQVDQGQLVRFTDGRDGMASQGEWGRMRIVYLQYASDPIVFFKQNSAVTPPDWMESPRGPDVSPDLRWYPMVSFLQHVVDMGIGLLVPMGHGHLYAYTDHIIPWLEVTEPKGWTAEGLGRLRDYFAHHQAGLSTSR